MDIQQSNMQSTGGPAVWNAFNGFLLNSPNLK